MPTPRDALAAAQALDTIANADSSSRPNTQLVPLDLESPTVRGLVGDFDEGSSGPNNKSNLDILAEADRLLMAAPSVDKQQAAKLLVETSTPLTTPLTKTTLDPLTKTNIENFDKVFPPVKLSPTQTNPSPSRASITPFSEAEKKAIEKAESTTTTTTTKFDEDADRASADLQRLLNMNNAPVAPDAASPAKKAAPPPSDGKGRRGSFGGRRNSFSKMIDFITGRGDDDAAGAPSAGGGANESNEMAAARATAQARGGGGRRRSFGELLGLVDSPRTAHERNNAAMAAAQLKSDQKQAKLAASQPKPRTIEDASKKPPFLRKDSDDGKGERRGFRASFRESFKNFIGVEEFESVASKPHGVYPPKIVKRLAAEAKRYENNLPGHLMSLKPNKSRNTEDPNINIFWIAEMEGPPNTIYEKSMILIEIFVSPEYPFKGPTLSYEGHVVEFVSGKNQTDPREVNILVPWTPAMSIIDAVLKVSDLLVEQQDRIEAEQVALERKREEKARIEEEVQRRVEETLRKERESGERGMFESKSTTGIQSPEGVKNPLILNAIDNQDGVGAATGVGDGSGYADGSVSNLSPPKKTLVSEPTISPNNNDGTPVVKLSKSTALPRRGSFRHSLTKGQGQAVESGLNLDALFGGDVQRVDVDDLDDL
jgi:ubiquitin-protein ligase